MADNLKLNEKDILNKKFKKDIKGYDASEVDTFLDIVINDYVSFKRIIADYDAEIASLNDKIKHLEAGDGNNNIATYKERIRKLEVENASYKSKFKGLSADDNVGKENYVYIKRLRELENFLYSLGYDPKTLKLRKQKESGPGDCQETRGKSMLAQSAMAVVFAQSQ